MAGLIGLGFAVTACGFLPGGDDGHDRSGRAPTWRTRVTLDPAQDGAAVAATGTSVVVRIGRSVLGLDRRTGRQRWIYHGREGDVGDAYVDVAVAGDVVAISGEKTGTGVWLDVLDATSGRTLWRHRTRRGGVTALHDAVYTADCARDCAVSRHHPRTGDIRWTLREPPETAVVNPDLDARIGRTEARALEARRSGAYVLLRQGSGDGPRDQVTAVEASTGRRLAKTRYTGWMSIATPRLLVVGEPVDERGDDPACRFALRGSEVRTGVPRWRGEVSAHYSQRDDRAGCSGLLTTDTHALGVAPDTLLATTADGRPQAFDLSTGRTRWTARRTGAPIDAGGQVVLVRDGRSRGAVRALELATGRPRWQGPDPGTSEARTAVVGDSVLAWMPGSRDNDYQAGVVVLDAADGRRRWAARPGSLLAGAGDDWFAAVPFTGTPEGAHDILFYELPR